jgi:hypothetical protein
MAPSEDLLARIETRLGARLEPVRPIPSPRALLWFCAFGFFSIVTLGAVPFALSGWHALSVVQRTGIFSIIGFGAALLAISMVAQMSPGSRFTWTASRLPAVIAGALLFAVAGSFRPEVDSALVSTSLSCLKTGLTYSFLSAILFAAILRHGAVLLPTLTGETLGALAGLTGFTVLEINCPNQNLLHVLAGHWGVILITLAAGTAIGTIAEYSGRRS